MIEEIGESKFNCRFCMKNSECDECRYKKEIKCSFNNKVVEEMGIGIKPTCKYCGCLKLDV